MQIDTNKIKELRDKTGISIGKCKVALEKAEGDIEKAIKELRKQGEAQALKKESRATKEGVIASYIHSNGKIGALVKIYCETDFVSRNEEFIALAKDIAMQVTATDPKYLAPEDVPQKIIKEEIEIEKQALKKENKPENIVEKILEGKMEKFKKENSLLTQTFIKDPDKTIEDLIKDSINKIGENIKIGDFKRFEI